MLKSKNSGLVGQVAGNRIEIDGLKKGESQWHEKYTLLLEKYGKVTMEEHQLVLDSLAECRTKMDAQEVKLGAYKALEDDLQSVNAKLAAASKTVEEHGHFKQNALEKNKKLFAQIKDLTAQQKEAKESLAALLAEKESSQREILSLKKSLSDATKVSSAPPSGRAPTATNIRTPQQQQQELSSIKSQLEEANKKAAEAKAEADSLRCYILFHTSNIIIDKNPTQHIMNLCSPSGLMQRSKGDKRS